MVSLYATNQKPPEASSIGTEHVYLTRERYETDATFQQVKYIDRSAGDLIFNRYATQHSLCHL